MKFREWFEANKGKWPEPGDQQLDPYFDAFNYDATASPQQKWQAGILAALIEFRTGTDPTTLINTWAAIASQALEGVTRE